MTLSTEVEPPVVTAPLSSVAAEAEPVLAEPAVLAGAEEESEPPQATSERAKAPASKEATIRFIVIFSPFYLGPFLLGRVQYSAPLVKCESTAMSRFCKRCVILRVVFCAKKPRKAGRFAGLL